MARARSWPQLLQLFLMFTLRSVASWTLGAPLRLASAASAPAVTMYLNEAGGLLDDQLAQLEQGLLNDSYESVLDDLSRSHSGMQGTEQPRSHSGVQPRNRVSIRDGRYTYSVTFHALGVDAGDVEVAVADNVLTVAAAASARGGRSRMERSIRLPSNADTDVLSITYADDEVTVSLQKLSEADGDAEAPRLDAVEGGSPKSEVAPQSEAERLAKDSPRIRRWLKAQGYLAAPSAQDAEADLAEEL